MKLLLTSNGIKPGFKNDFLSLLPNKPLNQISVSYIITAAFGENGAKSWVNIAKEDVRKLGISNIEDLDIRGKTENELYSILSEKDVVLVNGGNTFYLLKYARESGFDQVVKQLINKGKIYIGVSAGSYLACPTIEQAHWKHQDRKDFGVKDLKGLNLVPFLITAHFNDNFREMVKEEIKVTRYPIVCLYDSQAVLVNDYLTKVVGEGKREFFNGFKENTK
ncbi:MAG: Type 1 glutamine amidotransferase-like domain-containing protein [Candidatus Levybacteria bacterium]|nr:Type 1 glutamine amidotransferase-like domain-containing protein [Candidatus Levybacteria bacterium]